MILRSLLRRKGRTALTLAGIAIGVAAIVALGALAQGLRGGFAAMAGGSQADLVLTQAGAMSSLLSSVDQAVADEVQAWPEVAAVDGVLLTNALLGEMTYLFLFGYDIEGFAIDHFRIVEGQSLADARGVRGAPLILGRRAAESLDKQVGETLRITGNTFRIVGLYETGNSFEDGGAVVPLDEAQALALQPRRVSMLYIKLRDPGEADQLRTRVERRFPDLTISTAAGFVNQEQMFAILEGMAMAVAGLAILIGGVGMTNALFMSVFERTREIGLLLLPGSLQFVAGRLRFPVLHRFVPPCAGHRRRPRAGRWSLSGLVGQSPAAPGCAAPRWWQRRQARCSAAGGHGRAQPVAAAHAHGADPAGDQHRHRCHRRPGWHIRGDDWHLRLDDARQPDRPDSH